MLIVVLTILTIIFAAILIRAEYRGPVRHIHLFKPLTMACIVLIAMQGQATPPVYKYLVLAGLIFSMAGDALLMPPWDRFAAGLGAFLVAHLCYIAAFISDLDTLAWWPLILLVIYGVVVYMMVSPGLGKLKLPVIIYIAVILVMAWLAWARWLVQLSRAVALLAFVGAVLFVVSDSILALNRFRGPHKFARALSLSTYFAAQWLIAGSVGALLLS
ncbi:MAG: lysoplasmalogenase [Anaerolineae bacterium]|nr:lysoplasmalogenase [Anaerolineae bacterium]